MSPVAYPMCRSNRQSLLISSAVLAIATAILLPQKASAQAFQGTPTTAAGTVAYDRATPGIETLTINSPTATINWAPNDVQGAGNINFLPTGNSATYRGGAELTDFTVLNRIVPTDVTRRIELNGTVLSQLAGGATGGNVWFYSPGGIVIGASAVFDVGGLLLSSIDVPNGFTASTNAFSAVFSKSVPTAGSIQIASGAQINARSNYVALVAPRIEQGGNIQVNGSAAYVAADQVAMTMNQGLFDIQVPLGQGTSDANGIVHTGTTGGASNATATDRHTIYMVAVPKNQALTMLLGGSVGFAPLATTAAVENGQIILSSGFNSVVAAGQPGSSEAGSNASIEIGSQSASSFTSDVFGVATGSLVADALVGDVSFSGDLSLSSRDSISTGNVALEGEAGHTLTVGGYVTLSSTGSAFAPHIGISANGGNVHIVGDSDLSAGLGTASLFAYNGSLAIDGAARLHASVPGGGLAATDGDSADVTAGHVSVEADTGGSITAGDLALDAIGFGQDNEGGGDLSGGDGTGGAIDLLAYGGTIRVNGDLDADAEGFGGNMSDLSTHGGTGHGGSVFLLASGGTARSR